MAFNDRPLGKGVGWSKVKPVVETAKSPRSFTFAVLKPFVVRKRFSEFDEMRNIVMNILGTGAALPNLPKKTLLKSSALDPKFIGQRRQQLEQFTRALMEVSEHRDRSAGCYTWSAVSVPLSRARVLLLCVCVHACLTHRWPAVLPSRLLVREVSGSVWNRPA